jgi:hypothetical protein
VPIGPRSGCVPLPEIAVPAPMTLNHDASPIDAVVPLPVIVSSLPANDEWLLMNRP